MKRFGFPSLVLAFAASLMAAPQPGPKKAPVAPTQVTSPTSKSTAAGAKEKVKGHKKDKKVKEHTATK